MPDQQDPAPAEPWRSMEEPEGTARVVRTERAERREADGAVVSEVCLEHHLTLDSIHRDVARAEIAGLFEAPGPSRGREGPVSMRRRWLWVAGTLAVLVALVVAGAFLIEEPLRRSMEREVNRRLHGYQATIGRLDLHPIGFSLDLDDVTVVQVANPDPPVAHIERLSASVEWRQLLRGRIVADFTLAKPRVYINRQHLRREAEDDVPLDRRGWQDALQAIYPLKINRFRVVDGDLTYVDADTPRVTDRPLRLEAVQLLARNIRNIASPEHVYPSSIEVEAIVFGTGRLALDGSADFLAAPHPGILADVRLEDVDLSAFGPVLRRANLAVRRGVLAAEGRVEYAPQVKEVHLRAVSVDGPEADLVRTKATDAKQRQLAKKAGEAAERAANHPEILVRIDHLRVRGGTFGFVNRGARRDYRVFIDETALDIHNLSNQRAEGTSTAKLTGRFMGSGQAEAVATFRAETDGPDFDLEVKIERTALRSMNDLLLAHGRFDVVDGDFSLYSEIAVKNRAIRGYVKPLFSNVKAYDPTQDRHKPALKKLYERVVEGVAKILENRPRDQVATVVDIGGRMENPDASTWQIIAGLLQNGFFKAILPGFEREAGRRV